MENAPALDRPENHFDFRHPDYLSIFRARAARIQYLRTPQGRRDLPALRTYYRENPADFISDWGVTVDPRVVSRGRAAVMPFLLFPRQRELVSYILRKWRNEEPGLVEKSRDIGASWIALATSCTLCLFYDDLSIGFGSRKEEYVDKLGFPKCLFYKARMFMAYLPPEFLGGFELAKHAPHMRLTFPGSRSVITGEAGDGIGRGDRTALYFVDEAAHLERPELTDMSLSATTNCRIDMSSVKGSANPFAIKRHAGKVEVFTFHWREDPRKDDAWYKAFKETNGEIVTAQEVDLNYNASVDMQLVPAEWVNAAVDAHVKLKLDLSGKKLSALDVADSGMDKNSWCLRDGVIVRDVQPWSGNVTDIFSTTERAAGLMDAAKAMECIYDSIGVGAGVKGDGRKINEERVKAKKRALLWTAYSGAAAVEFPEQFVMGEDGKPLDVKNEDQFLNKAAQDWWHLRQRFQQTWRAVNGLPFKPEYLISLDSKMANLSRLQVELSQPQYEFNTQGKTKVVKTPDGMVSPNLADSVRMVFCVRRLAITVSQAALDAI